MKRDTEPFRNSEDTKALLLVSLGHHQVDASFSDDLLSPAIQLIRATCPQIRVWEVPVTALANAAIPA